MVWIAVGGVVALVTTAFWVIAWSKRDGTHDRDLGSISGTWLNERRASDREGESQR